MGDHLTVCPGYCADQAYTNPDNTGMQPHNQHARHRRMEWIPRAHISNQNISVFWVTHLIVIFFIVVVAPQLGTLRVVPCRWLREYPWLFSISQGSFQNRVSFEVFV